MKKLRYVHTLTHAIFKIKNFWIIPLLPFAKFINPEIQFQDGTRFKISHYSDLMIIKEIYLDQGYQVSGDPKVIIDIGANIGTFTVYAARYFPKSRIFSFEPAKKTFSLLDFNIQINLASNTNIFNKGVWSRKGIINFYSVNESGLGSVFNSRKSSLMTKINTITLQDIFIMAKIKKCNFLKVDCEGAEYEILNSLSKTTFRQIDKIVCEYHDSLTKLNHQHLVKLFNNQGFSVKIIPHKIETDIGIIEATRV